jgi:hypothetical protein
MLKTGARMSEFLTSIAGKKKRLDKLRPLSPEALAGLEHYYDIRAAGTGRPGRGEF